MAAVLLGLWVRIPRGDGCLSLMLSVVRLRSLRRADHPSIGVVPSVVIVKPRYCRGFSPRGAVAPWGKKSNDLT